MDDFRVGLLAGRRDELLTVILKVLCMSHGNAIVESGFSVNKEMVVVNQSDESLVHQHVVYNAIREAGGVAKMDMGTTTEETVILVKI